MYMNKCKTNKGQMYSSILFDYFTVNALIRVEITFYGTAVVLTWTLREEWWGKLTNLYAAKTRPLS